jgi:hypothetical protein
MPGENRTGSGIAAVNGSDNRAEDTDRKPESGSAEPSTFDFPKPISPIDASFGTSAEPESDKPKRKYTRRTAFDASARTEIQKTAPDLSDLKSLIFSFHQALSAVVPEMELDKEEAQRFADATQNLMKHYDHKVNPKVMAWMQFSSVLGGLYGPRAVAIWKRTEPVRVERAAEPAPAAPRAQERQRGPVKPLSQTSPSELWPQTPVEGN